VTEQPSQPDPAERGRYAVYELPDGALLITRAAGICERCQDCGCGEQRDPLGPVPAAVIEMAKAAAAGKMRLPSMKQLKQLAGAKGPGNGRR
jgi:hypothetical protein